MSTLVSKQLDQSLEHQKQNGCGPPGLIATLNHLCMCVHAWDDTIMLYCVYVFHFSSALSSSSLGLVQNNRTQTSTHGGSGDSCIPKPQLPSCATHTKSGQRKLLSVTTFMTAKSLHTLGENACTQYLTWQVGNSNYTRVTVDTTIFSVKSHISVWLCLIISHDIILLCLVLIKTTNNYISSRIVIYPCS